MLKRVSKPLRLPLRGRRLSARIEREAYPFIACKSRPPTHANGRTFSRFYASVASTDASVASTDDSALSGAASLASSANAESSDSAA